MDVDVVLNAILDLHQQEEIQKTVKARDVVLESRKCYLYRNDQVFCELIEFTMNQSRTSVPIYEIGGSVPREYVTNSSNTVTGRVIAVMTPYMHRTLNPTFQLETPKYHLIADQMFSDGSVTRIRISNMMISEVAMAQDLKGRVHFDYQGTLTLNIDRNV